MPVLPVILLALAVFVGGRLLWLAAFPSARQVAPAQGRRRAPRGSRTAGTAAAEQPAG